MLQPELSKLSYLRHTHSVRIWYAMLCFACVPCKDDKVVETSAQHLQSDIVRHLECSGFPGQTNSGKALIETSKSQEFSLKLALLLAALGICVFCWGLGYKLSLYGPLESTIHRIPVAKLISRNEDPDATRAVRDCLSIAASAQLHASYLCLLLASFAVSILTFSNAAASRQYLKLVKPWCLYPTAVLSAFFLRPPPALPAL
jgi:hypothetical protein